MAIAALILASCAGTNVMRGPNLSIAGDQDPAAVTRSALRNLLSRNSRTDAASLPLRNQLLAFYESRAFQPVWSGGSDQEEMAAQLRAVLAKAQDQGLSDQDYQLPPHHTRLAPGADAAQYDLALSNALFRYSRDLRTGRVAPADVYDDVDLPIPPFDVAAAMAQALKNRSFTDFLAALTPSHPEYRRLAAALARYRVIADEGGWPSLQGKKEIRLARDPQRDALIKRLTIEDPILESTPKLSGAELAAAVKRFQARMGLEQDGRVRGATLAALNVPASARVDQIAANMERWRWLPQQFERRYVAVNVPDQSVKFVGDEKILLESRAVVGRKTSPTPLTRSAIKTVVVNPPWNVPGDIAARDLLPHLKRDPNYLASKHMVVMDGPANDPHGRTIDWRKIVPAEFPYAIRQLPGPKTALGAIMLDSPNDFDVYLHDTPNKNLFALDGREVSNGCVRVQQIFPLASLALTGDAEDGMAMLTKARKSGETQRLALDDPLPVYFLYWTAVPAADGSVGFRPDLYGRDTLLIGALKGVRSGTANGTRTSPAATESSEADELAP